MCLWWVVSFFQGIWLVDILASDIGSCNISIQLSVLSHQCRSLAEAEWCHTQNFSSWQGSAMGDYKGPFRTIQNHGSPYWSTWYHSKIQGVIWGTIRVEEFQYELSVREWVSQRVCEFVEFWGAYAPKNEDNLKYEDDLKNEVDLKKERQPQKWRHHQKRRQP